MDKIFEQNVIEQDNILCKVHPDILKIISECLSPIDVVHLSHTCKELHQKLPFYLLKSGTFTTLESQKGYLLFEGPASNFSISEINLSFTVTSLFSSYNEMEVWIQIIRKGIVVQETQKYLTEYADQNYQIKIKNATLKKCKFGDILRFMGQHSNKFPIKESYVFQVSLQLENHKYGKPIDTTKKSKGYAGFKYPSVSTDIEDAPKSYFRSSEDLHSGLHDLLRYPSEGNTNF